LNIRSKRRETGNQRAEGKDEHQHCEHGERSARLHGTRGPGDIALPDQREGKEQCAAADAEPEDRLRVQLSSPPGEFHHGAMVTSEARGGDAAQYGDDGVNMRG
jgi:hypothetical protein